MGSFDACRGQKLTQAFYELTRRREDANEVTGPRLQGMVQYSFPKA